MKSTQHLVLLTGGATDSGVRVFELADEFWKNFSADRHEMLIGKIRSPAVLDAIFKLLRR